MVPTLKLTAPLAALMLDPACSAWVPPPNVSAVATVNTPLLVPPLFNSRRPV